MKNKNNKNSKSEIEKVLTQLKVAEEGIHLLENTFLFTVNPPWMLFLTSLGILTLAASTFSGISHKNIREEGNALSFTIITMLLLIAKRNCRSLDFLDILLDNQYYNTGISPLLNDQKTSACLHETKSKNPKKIIRNRKNFKY